MKFNKLFAMFLAAGLGGWTMAALAAEESADSVDVGKVKVTGQNLGNGQMVVEEAGKARTTITKEALEKMAPAANAIDKLKYKPGINVSSSDSTGLSGTTFTMRGMQSDQIGVSMDGIPINDSGSYELYPNLMGDPENLGEVFATQGVRPRSTRRTSAPPAATSAWCRCRPRRTSASSPSRPSAATT